MTMSSGLLVYPLYNDDFPGAVFFLERMDFRDTSGEIVRLLKGYLSVTRSDQKYGGSER